MQFKHKLIYFALGCAFVVIAQVLLSVVVPKVTAQGKKEPVEFDTVKVRSLEVVDDSGKVRVQLEGKSEGKTFDAAISVYNRIGSLVYRVGAYTDGSGSMLVMDDGSRKSGVFLLASTKSDGGNVSVFGDGKGRAAMSVNCLRANKLGDCIGGAK